MKHLARVVAVGNECDTAILTVDSAVFWDELEAVAEELGELPYLEPGPLPMLQEECAVVGFPSPGESVCVTQGVCSRVEVRHYFSSSLLAPLFVLDKLTFNCAFEMFRSRRTRFRQLPTCLPFS